MEIINMKDLDLCNDVYKRVCYDEKIRGFFETLTKNVTDISKSVEKQKQQELKPLKPDLSNISNKMEQLIESGIDIDDKNWWLSEELYSFNSYFGNLSLNSSFAVAFLNVKFNGIKLDINEFDYLGCRINTTKQRKDGMFIRVMPVPINLIEDYSIWSKNNKNLLKQIEKAEKKYENISKESKKSELKSQISFMKKNLERGNEMKFRIDFFESLTNEQIKLIYEIFNEVKEAKTKYDENRQKINEITEKYKKLESTTYERAFIKLIEEGITQSQISTIITKIFKTVFVRKFMITDTTLPDSIPEKYLVGINTNIINWFIEFKKEDFSKLYDEIFDNFDLFYESFEEKILKKD